MPITLWNRVRVAWKFAIIASIFFLLGACASQTPPVSNIDTGVSEQRQRSAQERLIKTPPVELKLKRKIAIGRLTNETTYGRSLLRTSSGDPLGSKVSDMFMQAVVNSQNYLVFERPDIGLLRDEAKLSGQNVDIVGVDTLVVGSLTQFGRVTTGERGFLSSSKKQEATATIDIRLVDVSTGRVFASVTGSGVSSTEHARTMGFGSAASYDGSLNDQAIAAAVTSAVDKMNRIIMTKPWTADVLAVEDGLIYISGGTAQGIREGLILELQVKGKTVKSSTTGSHITLPGRKVGMIKVLGVFGDNPINEGAYGSLIQGSIENVNLETLQVKEQI